MVTVVPHLPMNLIFEPMFDYMMELIPPHEAIARAQNALTLWLME